MNKQALEPMWAYLHKILGNARRQVELIPEDKFGFKPTPDVRSIGELCIHLFTYVTESTETVLKGKHEQKEEYKFTNKADLLKWMDGRVEQGYANFAKITDAQLAATINAWGMDFPAWQMVSFVFDEVLHHRGQLTVYLRLIGITPVFIYDYVD
ncbi:hypothetical protein EHM69_12850 [candidate division KSB1 bacterium]|nr:MAG: hypothetical protein EHM69_12850 [candidate division KSB1 bacterium]